MLFNDFDNDMRL